MKHHMAIVLGSLLFAAGWFTTLLLAVATLDASINGVFANIVHDAPSRSFASSRCPLLMGNAEVGQIAASITNPTSAPIEYFIHIAASGLTVDAPSSTQILTVPGRRTSQLAWQVVAQTPGRQAVVVQATSANDLALPGPYHVWPTSFRQVCGILIIDSPLTGAQMVGLCGLCLLAGAVLVGLGLFQILHRVRTSENTWVA